MELLPALSEHKDDHMLHEDVRRLADTLGRVIRRLEGKEAFEAVETLRRACRSRRLEEKDAPELGEILSRVDGYSVETAAAVARAFTLFFLLINTAEQVQHVRNLARRKEAGAEEEAASIRWALARLKETGHSADEAAEILEGLDIRPVLTAHPTEATRRTILDFQARVADILLSGGGDGRRKSSGADTALESEIELLWLTAEVRFDRPSVTHEVSNVLWYLKERFLDAESRLFSALCDAFEEVYGRDIGRIRSPFQFGSWVGGDRDGNPYVTPEVTLEAVREASVTILDAYREKVRHLIGHLSVSEEIKPVPVILEESLEKDREELPEVWEANWRRNAGEPLRMKLSCMGARLDAVRRRIEEAPVEDASGGYGGPGEFEKDLVLIRETLEQLHGEYSGRRLIEPLLACVAAFGFHGYRMDIREDARWHREALDDIAKALGMAPLNRKGLERELLGRRPLVSEHLALEDRSRKTLSVFEVVRKARGLVAESAVSTYIISMAREPEDLLRVLLLGREAGLVDLCEDTPRSGIDVVPLFETLDDLVAAPDIMRSLFSSKAYRRQLEARNMRQEVMIGYSDSTKDAGILPASWALYQAQEKLAAVCEKAGVEITFFHGRGGTVGRGGGSPVFRALTSLPPGSVRGKIKVTEQGEVISQKYGLIPVAERSLEALFTGTLLAASEQWCEALSSSRERRFREVMGRMAEKAHRAYREVVYDQERTFDLFLTATPVRELSNVHFGSRPAYREDKSGTIEGMRAIPWVFGWTQIRFNLPAWLGVGTALSQVADEDGGIEILREMTEKWCFFNDLLGKIEMICAKTDLEMARSYMEVLDEGARDFWSDLEDEFRRTVEMICKIRRADHLLQEQPLLQTTLRHREPYLDPLSLLQISLLRRKQEMAEGDSGLELLDRALGTTLNGIAQGLRNTG